MITSARTQSQFSLIDGMIRRFRSVASAYSNAAQDVTAQDASFTHARVTGTTPELPQRMAQQTLLAKRAIRANRRMDRG